MSESRDDRHHRQLDELLTEIRVVLPGVQVMFAFLLSLPFLTSFHSVTQAQRIVYFIAFMATTVSMALLIVTPAYHRVRFQEHYKARIIYTGNTVALLALAFLGVAVVGVVYVVTDVLFHWPAAVGTAGAVAALCVALWYWLPARSRIDAAARTEPSRDDAEDHEGEEPAGVRPTSSEHRRAA